MSKEFIIDENLTQQLMTDEKALNGFIAELQNYLKTKLEPCENDKGVINYWTCGKDHFYLPPNYEPRKNIIKFCKKKKLDWEKVIERIELYVKFPIYCDCFIVNRINLEKI